MDTVEICPKDGGSRITVNFTDFDLAPGDSLFAFDGNIDSVRTSADMIGIGSGSGVGVSQFCSFDRIGDGIIDPTGEPNGKGWVTSSCSPSLNPSGCITFILATNGDNNKGAGWEAWVKCEERTIELGEVVIPDLQLTCADATFGTVTFDAPTVSFCGVDQTLPGDALVRTEVMNAQGDICHTSIRNAGGTCLLYTSDAADE